MKKSPPKILGYIAVCCTLVLVAFLYVIIYLNFHYRQIKRNEEVIFNQSNTLLRQLRLNMIRIGKHQNSYLLFPNSKDSLDFVAACQAAGKSIKMLYTSCQDSIVTCSEISRLDSLLGKSLALSETALHKNKLNIISKREMYIVKERNDLLIEIFFGQIDKILANSRSRLQRIHTEIADSINRKNQSLSIGIVCIILVILYLIYQTYQQLNEKNRLLKRYQVFENAGDGLLVTDADFRINYVNRKATELLNKEVAELEGVTLWELMPSLASQIISEKIHQAFSQQEFRFAEIYQEPVATWFRVSIYPFRKGLSLVVKDINEIKRAESELHTSRKLYEFTSYVNDLILHAGTEEEIYPAICRLAIDSEYFLFAWVGKPDASGELIQPLYSAGKSTGYIKGLVTALTDVPEGQGPIGKAYRLGKYYYCNDIATDPVMEPWREMALANGFRSAIALPIRVEQAVTAVITFYASAPYFFTVEQLRLMERVMDNVSFALTAIESARKRQEAEQQLQIVSQAIEQSHVSVVITNAKGTIQYVNPAFTNLTGYTLEELYAQTPRVLKTGHTADAAYTELWEVITEGRVWQGEFLNKKKNGETYWESATISPILNKEGRVSHYVAVKENITARKKLEAEQQHLLRVFENTHAFMGTCDMHKNLIYGNRSLRDALEIGDDDITQYNIDDFRPVDGKAFMQEVYDALFASGKWLGENSYVSKSGKEIPVMQVIMLHLDEQGKPAYLSTTAIDLSKMKAAEKELLRLNNELRNFTRHLQYIRETEKNTITKEIHDELGQGLASLKMDAAWIKRHLDDGKDVINAKLDTLLDSISEKISAFNKIYLSANTSMIDEIGLQASVQYQAGLFMKNYQIPVSLHSNMDQVRIRTDQGLNIYRILAETLSNVYLHANATRVSIELQSENEMLLLTIQDNGKGFDYHLVDTRKHHGLVDIRERVLAMNGKLFIHSKIHEGTTLTIQVKLEKRSD